MTLALVRKLFRDVRLALVVVAVILAGFQVLWVKITQRMVVELSPLFATIMERAGILSAQIDKVLFAGPGKLVQTLAGGEGIRFERAGDMLSIGYVHPLMQAVFCFWAIGRAATAVAGEIDRGTMELLAAQPVPRSRVILAHLLVDAIAIPALALSLWGGTLLGYRLIGPFEVSAEQAKALLADLPFRVVINPELLKADPVHMGVALWNVVGLMFAVSGVTMALSAVGRFRGRVLGLAVLVFLIQFIINVVGQLWDTAAVLRPLTVFYYYQPQQIILHGRWTVDALAGRGTAPVPVNVLAVLFGVGAVGYLAALWAFCRRDLPAPL
jgi:ABC-2 type transport system permease protein